MEFCGQQTPTGATGIDTSRGDELGVAVLELQKMTREAGS